MSLPSFPVKKILILLILLAVPGTLYYLLKEKGQNRYRPLNIYGEKKVATTFHSKRGKQIPDTIYHVIRDFSLLNQNGETIKFPADSNQITVVNFFYTRCPLLCRDMNTDLARVAKMYSNNRLMRFISITVDPEYDSPAVLAEYSKPYTLENKKWDFLTGDKNLIYLLAREDFMVDAIADTTAKTNIIHSPMLMLIDPQKRIRGYYDSSLGHEQITLLSDEIKLLITEELRTIKVR
ncbi:MAG: SCO family protein [Daejeonella sp.]|uniref:SCO family protein n=1 Tax=Daejeonella sp. TaxID=2805397 RepID=UPI002735D004|nr:SCO family protein [Daejeonella sp.]MDP3469309.1 SCO family protein [Daejeonella sp.]